VHVWRTHFQVKNDLDKATAELVSQLAAVSASALQRDVASSEASEQRFARAEAQMAALAAQVEGIGASVAALAADIKASAAAVTAAAAAGSAR